MRPDRGRSSPMTLLSSVVLPTPFRPMRQTTSPGPTCKWTSRRIRLSPYATDSCSMVSIGLAVLSQINLNHLGVPLHFRDGALAENLPLVQYRHHPGNLAHERHIVIDHQQRVLAGHRQEQLARPLRL